MSSSCLPQRALTKAHLILLSISAPFNLSRIHGNRQTIPAFEISQFAFCLLVLRNEHVLSCSNKITNTCRILRSLMRMATYYHKGIANSRHFLMTRIITPSHLFRVGKIKTSSTEIQISPHWGKAWSLMVLRADTSKYSIKHHGQNTNTWAV